MSGPVYTSNIPQPKNIIGTSQDQFKQNFQSLYNTFAVNHVPLDAASGAGNHTVIQLVEQTNNLQTDLTEISVYARDVEGQTDQLFMRYEGNPPEFQYSTMQPTFTHADFSHTTFITFLPGKMVIFFGTVDVGGSISFEPYPLSSISSATFCAMGTTPRTSPFTTEVKAGNKIVSLSIPKNSYYFMIVGYV